MSEHEESPAVRPKKSASFAAELDKEIVEAHEDEDDDLDDPDQIKCSLQFLAVCLLMPLFNGLANGFSWAALALYYRAMGWPIARAGVATASGFLCRMGAQQVQLRFGFWVMVPLGLLHLMFAVLAIFYTESEWAIFLEIVALQTLDTTVAIEGIAFHVYGESENMARKATSTVLGVFTIAMASSVTIGGLVYDAFSWRGMAVFHALSIGSLVLTLIAEPTCRRGCWEYFYGEEVEEENLDSVVPRFEPSLHVVLEHEQQEEASEASQALPALPLSSLPGAVDDDLQVDDLEGGAAPEASQPSQPSQPSQRDGRFVRAVRVGKEHNKRGSARSRASGVSITSLSSEASWASAASYLSNRTVLTMHTQRGSRKSRRTSRATNVTRGSNVSRGTNRTAWTQQTTQTVRTPASSASKISTRSARTMNTMLSRVTDLAMRHQFQNHFGAASALRPTVAPPSGVDDDTELRNRLSKKMEEMGVEAPESSRGRIPEDVRLPVAFVILCSFNQLCSYVIEFSTFAIFFKEQHGWDEAVWASLSQSAGDLSAAFIMQILSSAVSTQDGEGGWLRRTVHALISQPYSLSVLLGLWVLFNLGMLSPFLPLVIASQLFMGTVYVYNCKLTTELNLFYALGDPQVFIAMQIFSKNAEAFGGAIASFLGPFLYDEVSPFAPFVFSTSVSFVAFLIYTTGFCRRIGFGVDIETAERRRAHRLGFVRVSRWTVTSRAADD